MEQPRDRLYIAVVGAGNAPAGERELARKVGRALAEAGAVVVCGGLSGAMEAACEGAHEAGGTTVGILPGSDRTSANRHVDVAIPTGMGEARNVLVVRASDALVAVSGEFGTLSEIAFALASGVPVVGLGTWELSRAKGPDDAIRQVDTPEAAVKLALDLGLEHRQRAAGAV